MEDREWNERVDRLCTDLVGKGRATAHQTTEMFLLHNDRVPSLFPVHEHGRSCSACVARVYKRVNTYWTNNIKK